MKNIAPKILIEVDYREHRSGIAGKLEQYPELLHVEMKQLPAGDYIVNRKVIIERKTWNDLLNSIPTGRIFKQANSMLRKDTLSLLILEGHPDTIKTRDVNPAAIQGALVHLSLFTGTHLLYTKDASETAEIILLISKQLQKSGAPKTGMVLLKRQPSRHGNRELKKSALLSAIPGVGMKKALILLQHFGSIRRISHLSPEKLSKIPGIGRKTACSIMEWLN